MKNELLELVAGDASGGSRGLGSVGVGKDGRLARRPEDAPVNFSFSYRGVEFVGQAQSGVDHARLQLLANLGALPYSMESSWRRSHALAIVRTASHALGGKLRLTRRQEILLLDESRFSEPMTPRLLLGSVVRLVLEAKPFIELLEVVVDPTARTIRADVA